METVTNKTPLETWVETMSRVRRAAAGRHKHVVSLEQRLKEAKHRENTASYACTILAGVLVGWKQQDPGKYRSAYRLINWSGTVVAKELLSPEDCAQAGEKFIPVVSLESVHQHACPICGPQKLLPVIEEYHQTEDGPDGDTWEKKHLIACPDCAAVFQIGETKVSFNRF